MEYRGKSDDKYIVHIDEDDVNTLFSIGAAFIQNDEKLDDDQKKEMENIVTTMLKIKLEMVHEIFEKITEEKNVQENKA